MFRSDLLKKNLSLPKMYKILNQFINVSPIKKNSEYHVEDNKLFYVEKRTKLNSDSVERYMTRNPNSEKNHSMLVDQMQFLHPQQSSLTTVEPFSFQNLSKYQSGSHHKKSLQQIIKSQIQENEMFAEGTQKIKFKKQLKQTNFVTLRWQGMIANSQTPPTKFEEKQIIKKPLKILIKSSMDVSNLNNLLNYDPDIKSKLYIPNLSQKFKTLKKINSMMSPSSTPKFNYYVGPGNNGELIKRIMRDRHSVWCEVSMSSLVIHFKWQQNYKGFNYDRMIREGFYLKEMVNYFEFHKEITSKIGLVRSLQRHYNYQMTIPFSILPVVFMINFEERNWDIDIASFVEYYLAHRPSQLSNYGLRDELSLNFYKQKSYVSPYKFGVHPEQTEQQRYLQYVKLQDVFMSEDSYLWLLKPADWNRGDGVHVFSSLEQLEALLQKYYSGWYQPQNEVQQPESPRLDAKKGIYYKCKQFVIQKYLEHPFLIYGRKFDIRVWVLMNHNMQFYLFREGYIRTSSNEFDLKNDNPLIHLTNNAIQKFSKEYGQFESANQLSYKDLQDYLDSMEDNKHDFRRDAMPSMVEYIQISLQSIRKQLNKFSRKYCFQIFGYDFMIDKNFKVWLIEVNTNPCIEESSPLLQMLMPRMINDAFKLSLDQIFPYTEPTKIPRESEPEEDTPIRYEKYIEQQGKGVYPVATYQDHENMWESLGSY